MRKFLNTYLGFSRKEYNGILVLLTLILLAMAAPYLYRMVDREELEYDQHFAAGMQQIGRAERYTVRLPYKGVKRPDQKAPEVRYLYFDPNGLPLEDWKRLGLSERQAQVIKNYEARGGRFRRPEDLKKMYSVSAAKYRELEPFIVIRAPADSIAAPVARQSFAGKAVEKEKVLVELNSADSALLLRVKGIGPAFASRIIKYRNRLGGFHSKEQLREVYGIDSARYLFISTQVWADAGAVQKISVNTAGPEGFNRHPYLSYKQVNAIVQYRRQHGPYSSMADLKKIALLNEEILRKIEPYLTF